MTTRDIVMSAAGATTDKTYIENVFSTNLWIGNSTSQTITNGIDLAGKGGLVWSYPRSKTTGGQHCLVDTTRGRAYVLASNLTNGNSAASSSTQDLTSFNSDGFSIGTSYNSFINDSGIKEVGWTFRKAPKFFDVQTKSHTTGTASTVDLSTLGTVGMVIVKRTDSTGNWYVWHNDLTSGYNAYLNTTAAQFNTNAYLSVSGTTLTIASGMPTGTYVIYGYAHDTSTDGLIQCGSYAGNDTNFPTINIGWEPQYILIKRVSGGTGDWVVLDTMRVITTTYADALLAANTTAAETFVSNLVSVTSTGFKLERLLASINTTGSNYIYMAIRRGLMKTPTDGTKVFQPIVRQGSGTTAVVNTTITPDLVIHKVRGTTGGVFWLDRLRDDYSLQSDSTGALNQETQTTTSFPVQMWDNQAGYDIAGTATNANSTSYSYIDWVFKRASGFFDIVCYTGTGSALSVTHNLGVAPEMIIVRKRALAGDSGTGWLVWHSALANTEKLYLNLTNAKATDTTAWDSTSPTSTTFRVGTNTDSGAATTYVAYLFASCPGVSKVGTYTGTGAAQQINCGFTSGARFVLIKRVDGAADWYVYDTARGIVTGNDPYLLMNSTAAEVTSTSYINPYSAGFEISSTAPPDLRANGVTCLYLAIA